MYKILNWLFGWDYVFWKNVWTWGISRVNTSKAGMLWYWTDDLLDKEATELFDPTEVIWLTCHPSKYFKLENKTDE